MKREEPKAWMVTFGDVYGGEPRRIKVHTQREKEHAVFLATCRLVEQPQPSGCRPEAVWYVADVVMVDASSDGLLYQRFLDLGVEIDSHESDMYVPVNEVTKPIVDAYKFRTNVTIFRSQIDGKLWYDIPFAYLPFWSNRERQQ